MQTAAVVAVALLVVVWAFQVALAAGAPLGKAAWGGAHHGVLPVRLRVASGVAALVVYPLAILFVLACSGLIEADWLPGAGRGAMWALTGFFGLGTVANLASRSPVERIWAPVALGIAVCCAVIAVAL